jgi:DNA-binding FrmR family transcriptional regulator
MSHIAKERAKLLNRMKRIRGQMETIERTLGAEGHECADVLMLLAAVRGGINGLMAEGAGGSHPSAFTAGMVHSP